MHPRRHRSLAAVAGVGLLAAALVATGPSPSAPEAALVAAEAPAPRLAYAARGPHAVGYRVLSTTDERHHPLTVRAWYPASPPVVDRPTTFTYSARNKFSHDFTPGRVITSVGRAVADARPLRRAKPYPLVVLSHAYGLSPIVYGTLAEHYASRGYVVLGPEHHERFDGSLAGFWRALVDRPSDIGRTIDEAERLDRPGALLGGLVDLDHIAVVGHSYGGYTALAAGGARLDFASWRGRCEGLAPDDPRSFFCDPVLPKERAMATRAGLPDVPTGPWPSLGDPRVTAVVSMAGDAYPFGERGLAAMTVPVMALGGTVDEGTPYEWGTGLTYDGAGSRSRSLVRFPSAGHMIFLDPCEQLPWTQASAFRDGLCTDAVWDRRPLDVVAHYTTAFLRATLDGDRRARTVLAGRQPHLAGVEYETTRRP